MGKWRFWVVAALGCWGCGRTSEDTPATSNGGNAATGGSSASGGRPAITGGSTASGGRPANTGGSTADAGAGGEGGPDEGLVCNQNGWCWVAPDEFGDALDDISGTPDEKSIFAVNRHGAVLERRAAKWRYHEDAPVIEYTKVDVVGDGNVWAGGTKGLVRYANGAWSIADKRDVRALEHTDNGEAWAILGWRVHRFDGSSWVDTSPADPMMSFSYVDLVTGPGPDEVWVLGAESIGRYHQLVLEHFDGSSWTRASGWSPRDYSLQALVRAGSDILTYGSMGVLYASKEWAKWNPPILSVYGSAWGEDDGTLFLVDSRGLLRLDPDLTQVSTAYLGAIWGSAGALWLGLSAGGAVRLSPEQARSTKSLDPLRAVVPWEQAALGEVPVRLWTQSSAAWASAATDVWRSATDHLEHFDGGAWSAIPMSVAATDIDGSAADDVWFVPANVAFVGEGIPELTHWDGEAFSTLALPADWLGYRLSQIKCFGEDGFFVAGQSETRARVGRFDGKEWQNSLEVDLMPWNEHWGGIEGLSASDVWVAGDRTLYHFDGNSWTTRLEAASRLGSLAVDARGVWAIATGEAYSLVSDASVVVERYGYGALTHVELTEDYVFVHSGQRVLRRRR